MGDRLRLKLLTLLDEAQKEVSDNYHSGQSLNTATKPSIPQAVNKHGDLANARKDPGSSTRIETTTILESGYQTCSQSLQGALDVVSPKKLNLHVGIDPKVSEVLENTASGMHDTMVNDNYEFGIPVQMGSEMQFELGQLNYLEDAWFPFSDKMDLDLTHFDSHFESEHNSDSRS